MASMEDLCGNYLLLKPEEAGLVDVASLLFSSDLDKRNFIDISDELKQQSVEFRRRWVIFLSVIMQRALLCCARPLAGFGYVLEMWLNLLSSNGGLVNLFSNFMKGKLVMVDRSSSTFRSLIMNLDARVLLDDSIRYEDMKDRQASFSMMASKLSYEKEELVRTVVRDQWNMDLRGFYSFWNDYHEIPSTKAIIVEDSSGESNLVVIAFRGTEPFNAEMWITDFDISWYEISNVGKIHSGFLKALGMHKNKGWPKEIEQAAGGKERQYAYYTIRQLMKDILQKNEKTKFIITGHSLGGALAILFVAILSLHDEAELLGSLVGVYTFGQPRVGDEKFGEFMNKKLKQYNVRYGRHVYCNDMVPRVPADDHTLFFKHFGVCLSYNSLYQSKVMKEEPNKNYFSLLWLIPKYLNAVWELIRSFIITYVRGPYYKESWSLKAFRLVGLLVPGLTAHFPTDYVNATQLGSLHAYQAQQLHAASKVDKLH